MNYVTIKPSGLLDKSSTNDIRQDVSDEIAEGAEAILLDFQEVSFMNSSGIGALVALLKEVKAKQKTLAICSLNAQISMIFELTKMNDLFAIYQDLNAFEQQYAATLAASR
ncbi:MAG: STAS domain-containing protein [Acaryochloridaceae cyanobacterium SU_2_1]|nr:STAS domain-containing protein [Acaryochloridaceae cyanobacterium SU_2_1]NJM95617.1 STAS domain-containing protein [Acaryochloridaceae cyanobacterium CSU_5_19]